MVDQTLKERLINKIRETDDLFILEEVSNLFELQEPESVYQVSKQQEKDIAEARQQIINQQTLTDKQANKEADEWLNE